LAIEPIIARRDRDRFPIARNIEHRDQSRPIVFRRIRLGCATDRAFTHGERQHQSDQPGRVGKNETTRS
jgi:hypothetical protein